MHNHSIQSCSREGHSTNIENCNTSYWKQVKAFINNGTVDPNPCNQVLQGITTFTDDQKYKGYEIILMMDADKLAEAKKSKIPRFMDMNSVHDVHGTTMRNLPVTTRLGIRSRIDFILATEGIL